MIEMMLAIQEAAQDALSGKPTNIDALLSAADALSPEDEEIFKASRANPKSWAAMVADALRVGRKFHETYQLEVARASQPEEIKQVEALAQITPPVGLVS